MLKHNTQPLIKSKPSQIKCSSASIRIISYTSFSITGSGFIYGTMMWLANSDQNSAAASSIASPVWAAGSALVLGSAYIATLLFSSVPGQKQRNNTIARINAGNILKVSWIVTAGVSTFVSIIFLLGNVYLPCFLDSSIATPTKDFLSGIAIGVIPMNLMITNIEVLFKLGKVYVPPVCGVGLLGISMGANILIDRYTSLGAFGVGLSASSAQTLMCIFTLIILSQKEFHNYHFLNGGINFTCKLLKSILTGGFFISTQRITEYGYQLLISLFCASYGYRYSLAIAASIHSSTLIASAFQSIAQAGGILMTSPKTIITGSDGNCDIINAEKIKIINITKSVLLITGCISISAAVLIILARKWISELFITDDQQALELSMLLLIINSLRMIPDSFRLAFIGLNRPWSPLSEIAVINFIALLIIASPASYLFSLLGDGFTNNTDNQSWVSNHSIINTADIKNHASILSIVGGVATIPLAITMSCRLKHHVHKTINNVHTNQELEEGHQTLSPVR